MSNKVRSDSTSAHIRAIKKQLAALRAIHRETLKEAAFGGMTPKDKLISEDRVARINALTHELLMLIALR